MGVTHLSKEGKTKLFACQSVQLFAFQVHGARWSIDNPAHKHEIKATAEFTQPSKQAIIAKSTLLVLLAPQKTQYLWPVHMPVQKDGLCSPEGQQSLNISGQHRRAVRDREKSSENARSIFCSLVPCPESFLLLCGNESVYYIARYFQLQWWHEAYGLILADLETQTSVIYQESLNILLGQEEKYQADP